MDIKCLICESEVTMHAYVRTPRHGTDISLLQTYGPKDTSPIQDFLAETSGRRTLGYFPLVSVLRGFALWFFVYWNPKDLSVTNSPHLG